MRTADIHAPLIVVRWMTMESDAASINALSSVLDTSEQIRADRFRAEPDRNTFIAAHALLRKTLSCFTGIAEPKQWRFWTDQYGKPWVDHVQMPNQVHFSLSHTRDLVVCAVGRPYALGIDAEVWHMPAPIDLASRYFARNEIRLIAESPPLEQAATFYRIWTLKEAYLKATGRGLATPLDSFAFSLDPLAVEVSPPDSSADWNFVELSPSPVHSLALAVRSPKPVAIEASAVTLRDFVDDLDVKL